MPKREVSLIFWEPRREGPGALPRGASAMVLNRYFENFFNEGLRRNTAVPHFWWQALAGKKPVERPDPDLKKGQTKANFNAPDVQARLPEVRQRVLARIGEMAGLPHDTDPQTQAIRYLVEDRKSGQMRPLSDEDALFGELGLDSLEIIELATWIAENFQVEAATEQGVLVKVGDAVASAVGVLEFEASPVKSVPPQWFQPVGSGRNRLVSLPDGQTLKEAFLSAVRRKLNELWMADNRDGAITGRQFLQTLKVFKDKFAQLEGPIVGVLLPPTNTLFEAFWANFFAGKTSFMMNYLVGPGPLAKLAEAEGLQRIITSHTVITALERRGFVFDPGFKAKFFYIESLLQPELETRFDARVTLLDKVKALYLSTIDWSELQRAQTPNDVVVSGTSGSTGTPKTFVYEEAFILAQLRNVFKQYEVREDDVLLSAAPGGHLVGLLLGLIAPSVLGTKVVTHTNLLEGAMMAKLCQAYGVTMTVMPPTALGKMAEASSESQWQSLDRVYTGAEALTVPVIDAVGRVSPSTLIGQGFGTSEAGVTHIGIPGDSRNRTHVGKLLPDTHAILVDPEAFDFTGQVADPNKLREVATGEVGVALYLKDEKVISGYRNYSAHQPFVTLQREGKEETYLIGGDLFIADPEGWWKFVGRLARSRKKGGEMISPEAIEEALIPALAGNETGPFLSVQFSDAEVNPEVILVTTRADLKYEYTKLNRIITGTGLSALNGINRVVVLDEMPLGATGKLDLQAVIRNMREALKKED